MQTMKGLGRIRRGVGQNGSKRQFGRQSECEGRGRNGKGVG